MSATVATLNPGEEAQLTQTIEMFEVITQSQPQDYQSLEILKEAYSKLGREKDFLGTSKRIAQSYVQMGQLSSAILEYETILQRCPEDPDVRAALQQIESKATTFASQPVMIESAKLAVRPKNSGDKTPTSQQADDGQQQMRKIFADSRIISCGDFDLCWADAHSSGVKDAIVEPFIQILNDRGIIPIEKALKILSDKSHTGFLPLDKYDVDLELTRKFRADTCRRWCVLPFDRMSKSILVATANPFNQQAAKELAEVTPQRLIWYLASPIEIIKYLRKVFR
jgi:hypothetical protein